ncbi:14536_t:CDS:2, partial [Acaulospora morrowiae]
MTNSGNGWGGINGNSRISSGSLKQQESINADNVMDIFNDIALTAGSDAILATDWQPTSRRDQGRDTRKTWGNVRVQNEIENDNFSADGKVKGSNRSQRESTTGFYEDANSRGNIRRNDSSRDSLWENNIKKQNDNDGRIYTANNSRNQDAPNDHHIGNGGYRNTNTNANASRLGSTDNYTNNNDISDKYDINPSNESNVIYRSDDEHPTHLTYASVASQKNPSSQELGDEIGDVALKISAWHTLVDPNSKERLDGIGTGQLHRKGKNYKPVDEKTVLEIQQRGKSIKKTMRSPDEGFMDKSHSSLTKSNSFSTGAPLKSLDRDNPSPKHDQNTPEKEHSNIQSKLDNPSFRELPQNSPQKPQTATKSQQPQYYRHQSPVRSQEYLPLIPPEFDSTPYRKQPSPFTAHYRKGDRNGNDYEDQEDCDQSSDATTEYYEDSDNELEYESSLPVVKRDRGELVLTINVELQEGENAQAIYVYVGDDPSDLAREFCVKWKVTNDVVEPALAALIKNEKEKRLG